jgi:hypothetical protein
MNKDEALKMAIEALEDASGMAYSEFSIENEYEDVINACKEALEQPAQEPVEVYGILDDGDYVSVEATKEGAIKQCDFMNKHDCNCTYKPLYTHPHQWQGLTDEEIEYWECLKAPPVHPDFLEDDSWREFARCIEKALKEKNT